MLYSFIHSRRGHWWIAAGAAVILLAGLLLWLLWPAPIPPASGTLMGWKLYRSEAGLLKLRPGDGSGAHVVLASRFDQAAAGRERVFYLDGSALYSVNADGSGTFRVTGGCTPVAVKKTHDIFAPSDSTDDLMSLGCYNGYVYVVKNQRLTRYAEGSRRGEQLSRQQVIAFLITEDGVLRAYDVYNAAPYGTMVDANAGLSGLEPLYELDLNLLS